MEIRNPKSGYDSQIGRKELVLDVGGGDNPHPRANIVVDKYPFNNYHRTRNLRIFKKQKFVVANGENLPFMNKTFDHVICSHVLEHSKNPSAFLDEISRVGKKGYIETPSLIGEYLIPKKSHKWVILKLDEKIVLMGKKDIHLTPSLEFGDLFQKYVAPNSIEFRIFMRTYSDLFTVRYEWKDKIDYIINPTDPKLRSFFTSSWNEEKILTMFKRKSKFEQITSFLLGFTEMTFDYAKSILLYRKVRRATEYMTKKWRK